MRTENKPRQLSVSHIPAPLLRRPPSQTLRSVELRGHTTWWLPAAPGRSPPPKLATLSVYESRAAPPSAHFHRRRGARGRRAGPPRFAMVA